MTTLALCALATSAAALEAERPTERAVARNIEREVQREGAPKVVYLNGLVAKEAWVPDPEQKRVQRLRGTLSWAPRADAAAQAAWQAFMQVVPAVPGAGGSAVERRHELRVIRASELQALSNPPVPPVPMLAATPCCRARAARRWPCRPGRSTA